MKPAYYNEHDEYPAQWLRNLIARGLIPAGDVDTRSIANVAADDLAGYGQCHFFAGIGGWALAARLAGWPDDRELWTGSCPCQPFSYAARGRNRGADCERHLWPEWFRLIVARRPATVFGEQVANAGPWWDGVSSDLESAEYTVAAAVVPAFVAAKDHARERIYFASYTDRQSESGSAEYAQVAWLSRDRGQSGHMARSNGVPARVGRLRAYGNAIVPQVAAEVIGAYMDCMP